MDKKTKDEQAKLTAKVKDSFKNFNSLTPEEQSMILGGFGGSFQDNGIGEDLFPRGKG